MKIPNVEKAMEGRSDGSTAKELIKLAEKDPLTNIELELMNALERAFEEAKENGFKGSMEDYVKTAPVDELKSIGLATGGDVDFTSIGSVAAGALNTVTVDASVVGRTVASVVPFYE